MAGRTARFRSHAHVPDVGGSCRPRTLEMNTICGVLHGGGAGDPLALVSAALDACAGDGRTWQAEGVALGVEWKRDNDYGEADGGTGKDADTFTTLLSAEF